MPPLKDAEIGDWLKFLSYVLILAKDMVAGTVTIAFVFTVQYVYI